jgi:alcohol dehydrogenase (cytochrome c)
MEVKKRAFAISCVIILVGTISATALHWHFDYWRSAAGLEAMSNERIWDAVSCRARLYLQKAQGGIPGLSWTELWRITLPGTGFHCGHGGETLEAGLQFSANASEADRSAGARIFRKQCSGCHGNDGSGGEYGPSLTRSNYRHGDSDLAIYKVLRDGVPGTAMPSANLPLHELLQVVADVRRLQAPLSDDHETEASRLSIQVSGERLQAARANQEEWLMYSGSYNGWRHTSLTEITPANVAQLRIRWVKQFDSNDPSIEATPLVIHGVIFTVAPASNVVALDARTGDVIWEYKRPIPADSSLGYGRVNRGLAVHGSTIFFGSLDGYLVAINANDGKVLWQTMVGSPSDGYTITGAPLVVNHSVVVGVAGGDYGARGFLAAYDVSTGQRQWKFETIPGPGEVGHETWGSDAWKTGGGGTWNTGSYDPSTDLLYWGVGNPVPAFSGDVRPGDNLYTDSVIALHASTGKLAWYFQFTPHDEHDWDSAQTPILADLLINGEVRKAICWPNRNGFYYVLDRVTGEFLAGAPFVELNWATGLTSAGRPILSDDAKVSTAGRRTIPGVGGGTNWQNPAFDQRRGLVFVPATVGSSIFTKQPSNAIIVRKQNVPFTGSGSAGGEPQTHVVRALDAPTGKRKWEYLAPSGRYSGPLSRYSGLLSAEGGLVFGAVGGALFALDADTGREVWRVSLGGTTVAAPISFAVDGRQVIAVAAGRALFTFGL